MDRAFHIMGKCQSAFNAQNGKQDLCKIIVWLVLLTLKMGQKYHSCSKVMSLCTYIVQTYLNKSGKVHSNEHTYFPNVFCFAILCISLAFIFICYRYKYIFAKLICTTDITLNRNRNKLSFVFS